MFEPSTLRRSVVAVALMAAALPLAGLTPAMASPAQAGPAPRVLAVNTVSAVPGSYIVELKDNAALRSQGLAARAKTLTSAYKGTVQQVWTHALHGFSVKMTTSDAQKLAADPNVASVTQDQYLASGSMSQAGSRSTATGSAIIPNATQTPPDNWGLDRIDQRKLPLDNKYHYDTAQAGQGVTAYVLVDGIHIAHHDFQGRASYGPSFVPDGHTNSEACGDEGTEDAGLIGGAANGVAKQVHLVAVRVFDCNGLAGGAALASGLDWIAGNAVKPAVAQSDLAPFCVNNQDTTQIVPCPADFAALVVEAEEGVIDAGVQVVQTAGNVPTDTCESDSGFAPDVLYVGGTAINDAKWVSSASGSCVDLWAPAVGVNSDSAAGDDTELTETGTESATALVTGAAALLLSSPQFRNASPAQLVDQLVNKQSTKDVITGLDGNSPNKLLNTNPPGSFTVGPSVKVAPSQNGLMALFGVNPSGFMVERFQTGAAAAALPGAPATGRGAVTAAASTVTWGPWITSTSHGWASVAADRNANGKIQLIGVTTTGELWQRQQATINTNTWISWSQLDSPTSLGITAVSVKLLANGRLMMFGSNPDGQAYFRPQTAANATTWGGWTALPFGGQARSITAESNTDGKIEVFVADTDGQVWHTKQVSANDTNWTAFTAIPGATGVHMVSAARHNNGRLDMFGIGDGGVISHTVQTAAGSSGYTAYTPLTSNAVFTSVAATTNNNNDIDVIAADASGGVWETTESGPDTTAWPAYTQIGVAGTLQP
jgi:Tectonin domain/Peptidase inhibitor I9